MSFNASRQLCHKDLRQQEGVISWLVVIGVKMKMRELLGTEK
jgi:hypothetical protein